MTAASTVVVELTPAGRAAVAVVLAAGPDAVRAVSKCFVPVSGRAFAELPLRRIALGHWGGAEGEELIACRRAEDQVEVHCHGGLAAVRTVIDDLVARGCRQISWQEWLQRSSSDPIQAAAHIALADAPTARTAAVLLDQYNGALTNAVHAAIELAGASQWSAAAEIVDGLLRLRDFGLHLTLPWRVVLAGAPNVGKSSLLNALVGFQRAIVSPQPGTTRDVVTLVTAIDGWPVQLTDTAGLRATEDPLESAGVALADAALASADLILVLSDATSSKNADDELRGRIAKAARVIRVWNKIDLVEVAERGGVKVGDEDASPRRVPNNPARLKSASTCLVSAVTGEGVSALVDQISRVLVPTAPPAGAAVAFTADQVAKLDRAQAALAAHDRAAAEAALKALLAAPDIAL